MSDYIVGIDLGSSKIAGMVVQKDKAGLLKILAVESEPSVGVRRGLIVNASEAAACVSRIVKKLQNRVKIEIGQVYVGLGGHTLKSVINKVPEFFAADTELTEEVLKALSDKNQAIEIEQAQLYESLSQEFLLDGDTEPNPEGCTCSHVEARYLLVLGKPGLDDRICSCLERIPRKLAGLFTSPIVMSESLVTSHDKELGCAVIDFGAETTTLVVYADHYIRHMAVVPFGGKTVTQDIKDMQLTFVDAENFKKNFGCALVSLETQPKKITFKSPIHSNQDHEVQTRNLATYIEARMDEIMDMVCMEIDKSGYGDQLRAGVMITGGASQLRGLPELINIKTGMTTRRASFDHLLSEPADAALLNPAHALLLGLVNFGTENCQALTVDEDISPVAPPPTPQKDKSKKKINKFKVFLESKLFNDRDFEENEHELKNK